MAGAAALWLAALLACAAAEPARPLSLRLRNGDYLAGDWIAVGGTGATGGTAGTGLGTLQWRSPAFLEPLEIPLDHVQSVQLPVREQPKTAASGPYIFELTSGEVLDGDLKTLSTDSIEVASPLFGLLRLPRGAVRQFFGAQESSTVAIGPRGMDGWYSARPQNPNLGMNPWAQNPNMQVAWVRSSDRLKQWSDREAPTTSVPGAQLRSEFELPAKSQIELDLSWQTKAAFTIVIGAGLEGNRDRTAFRLEVWDNDLVLVRENDQEAIVRPLLTIPGGNGQLRLHLFHDRVAERLLAFSGNGAPLADVTFAPKASGASAGNVRREGNARQFVAQGGGPQANNGGNPADKEVVSPVPQRKEPTELVITNVLGDLRLDGFRVSTWNGVAPPAVEMGKSRLQRTDGRVEIAEPVAFEPDSKTLRVKDGSGERSEPLAAFSRVILGDERSKTISAGLHVHLQNGNRLFGVPLASPVGRLRLRHASFEQTLDMPIDEIRSVSLDVMNTASPPTDTPGAIQLTWNGGSLAGTLVNGRKTKDSTGLVWKPLVAVAPASLRIDFSGRIVTVPTPKPTPTPTGVSNAVANEAPRLVRNAGAAEAPVEAAVEAADEGAVARKVTANVVGGVARLARGLVAGAGQPPVAPGVAAAAANPSSPPAPSVAPALLRLHLRSGEVIPCQKLAIDEQGLLIASNISSTPRIAHDQVKAIEMLATAKPPRPIAVKRDRLLMVPRTDRAHPPTHIVRSRDADYLRGRLLELDDEFLTIEVRMETKRLPRELVSHIIWINADEVDAPGAAPSSGVTGQTPSPNTASTPGTSLSMLALRKDGVRLGFEPLSFENGVLTGTNRNLGEVRVAIHEVDQFLIGAAVSEAGATMPYARWRWTSATLPKVATGQGGGPGGSRQPGMDSPLVGKPAPAFKLPMLAGPAEFDLNKQRGRIVILDFWASWCGPCLKTMPVLEKVVREQPTEAKVDLIAVNLEETPRQITAMLDRHGWKMPVALDQDGAVAAKYAATAIPQTVIIDREGKVARLFVGGGPQFEAELRSALTDILAPAKP
jgi:thiol-disulfide isomerase/thioredoxin